MTTKIKKGTFNSNFQCYGAFNCFFEHLLFAKLMNLNINLITPEKHLGLHWWPITHIYSVYLRFLVILTFSLCMSSLHHSRYPGICCPLTRTDPCPQRLIHLHISMFFLVLWLLSVSWKRSVESEYCPHSGGPSSSSSSRLRSEPSPSESCSGASRYKTSALPSPQPGAPAARWQRGARS